MPRPLRDTAAGVFHVYTHAVWAAPALFRDDLDRVTFLRELALAAERSGWRLLAFCLMRTHYHLIVDADDGALPKGMHSLNFRFAMAFNHRHGMRGHVHGSRYGARRLQDDWDLVSAFRYVARNPIEAGLCAAPAAWPWSSYGGTVGLADPISIVDPRKIVGCIEGPPEVAIGRLRAFVENQ